MYAPQDDGSHLTGLAALAAPSFGYIIGFILSAALTGWLAQRQWDRKILGGIAAFVAGTLATFLIGVPWLAIWLGAHGFDNGFTAVFMSGIFPFLIPGAIKAVVGAGIIRLIWAGVKRADARATHPDAD